MSLDILQKMFVEQVSFLVTDVNENPEYVRGMCETLAVLFPSDTFGMARSDIETLAAEMKNYLESLKVSELLRYGNEA